MLLIDAVYIHEGGGKSLLIYFIDELIKKRIHFFVLFDKRLDEIHYSNLNNNNYEILDSNQKSRKYFYKKNYFKYSSIFCFANVPPPIKINASVKTFIFCHNVLLFSSIFEKNSFSLKIKFLFLLKRIYIYIKNKKHYNWVVQTPTMKNKLSNIFFIQESTINILPFYENLQDFNYCIKKEIFSFVYVASGTEHKNHINLLDAWEILFFKYNLTPKLTLTIPEENKKLIERVNILIKKGLRINNIGECQKHEIVNLYKNSEYLIFPSLSESFGLPLIEAVTLGCKVIASDLPYVYDLIVPTNIFNPLDSNEIAKVVNELKYKTFNDSQLLIFSQIDKLINLFLHV